MHDADRRSDAGRGRPGFTLVELLIIIGIISILFAVTLVAVDPARRFKEARDAVRRQDVRSILEATLLYLTDNRGNYPSGIDSVTSSVQILGTNASGCNTACATMAAAFVHSACADISGSLVESYLASIPIDPGTGTAGNTRYYIQKTTGGRIEVGACDAEQVTSISVKR